MKQLNIGICGLGTVGGGTYNVLSRNQQEINARADCDIHISHIGARRDNPDCTVEGAKVSRDIFDVVNDPDVDIVVELIGGTTVAKDLVEQAIKNGKHVVTANKALIAEHGNALFELARKHQVSIGYESAVAGGIPIISALREGLAANRIDWLAGIINGTGNFILSEMKQKGRAFADVLKEAQELGYAEADPTFDVEGIDAAHKLVIMASIAFGMPLEFEKIFTEGISNIEPIDVEYADELGFNIKHLGIAKRRSDTDVELRVHPTLIPKTRLIANVDGVMNAVVVQSDAVGPTLYYGAGAGAEPTASAVISDLVRVCRSIKMSEGEKTLVPSLGFNAAFLSEKNVLPISEVQSAYYLRLNVLDERGVLSQITQILSEAGISIEALIQKPMPDEHKYVPLIVLTNVVLESDMMSAIAEIEKLSSVDGSVVKIRVEALSAK